MNVQPYFPDPIVVRNNAADEKYDRRLKFVRDVSYIHLLSGALVAIIAVYVPAYVGTQISALSLLVCLLLLSIVRQLFDGGKWDSILSAIVMLPTIYFLGICLRQLSELGFPVWEMGIALLFAVLYAALCGRDYSFVGQFSLAGAATAVCVTVIGILLQDSFAQIATGVVVGMTYLFYYVYDLAALLTRRRIGEEVAACADLYRDVLNFITYSLRVARHWRQFRI